jgi:hypothetical protein
MIDPGPVFGLPGPDSNIEFLTAQLEMAPQVGVHFVQFVGVRVKVADSFVYVLHSFFLLIL